MVHQIQVSDLLDGFGHLGGVDGAGGAVLGEPAAAVGQGPNLQLPGPVVHVAAVLYDVVGVEIGVSGVLAVGVQGQQLGGLHELVPAHGGSGVGIIQARGVEHVLVVVQEQSLVGAGVGHGNTVGLEGDGVQGHGGGALVHGGDVSQQAVGGEVQNAVLVHDAAVRQLIAGSHGVEGGGVLLVGDGQQLHKDVVVFRVELVQDGLGVSGLLGGAPVGVGDGYLLAAGSGSVGGGCVGGRGFGVLAAGLRGLVGAIAAHKQGGNQQHAEQDRKKLLHVFDSSFLFDMKWKYLTHRLPAEV